MRFACCCVVRMGKVCSCSVRTSRTVHMQHDTCSAAREQRLNALHAWQRFYNMDPRSDSRLTHMFVNGEIDWPVDVVARELMATHYIFHTTLYGELIERFLREVANRLRRRYRISWAATWEIVRFYGPIALKLICLMQTHGRIPQRLA